MNKSMLLWYYYYAIDSDQLVKELNNMLLSVIKAAEPNIKNVTSLSFVIDIFKFQH